MIALLFLAWLLVGAVGALLCVWIIGGVGALGALAPKDGKGALRLFFACDLGAIGGITGGLLMRYLDSLAQPDGTAYAGAIIGGALGAVFFPFLLFSISRLLELAFVRGRKNTLVELRLLKPLGCLILLVGPIAGIGLGGNLGYAYGTGSFLLSGVIAPLAGGITFLVVPVMIWLIGRASDEEWRTGGRMGATELSGFARMRYERVQQRRRRR